jgi:uncharacterized phage protein gp47/JayE
LQYRIGTFPMFRQAMLDDLTAWLPALRAGVAGASYGTMLVELWAYVADVLAFYQEQIANEAFIGTATQRSSLFRLAELIGYRPKPGASGSAILAFTLAPGKTLTIPQGLRTGSKPAGGHPAATFETDAPIAARAEHNRIPLAAAAAANQFASLSALVNVFSTPLPPFTSRSDLDQFHSDVDAVFGPVLGEDLFKSTGLSYQGTFDVTPSLAFAPVPTSRTVAFEGINLKIRPGDYLLIFDQFDGAGNPKGEGVLREVTQVVEDRPTRTTRVTWPESAGDVTYRSAAPRVFVFRAKAAPFGANAPDYRLVSPYLTKDQVSSFGDRNKIIFEKDWGTKTLPEKADDPFIFELDRVYDAVVPSTPSAESWLVLFDTRHADASATNHQACRITAVHPLTRSDYLITARVSQLRLDRAIKPNIFALRTTVVLVQSELLRLANARPLPEPVGGATLILGGQYPTLTIGQAIVVSGRRYDPTSGRAGAESFAQDAVIDDLRTDTPAPAMALTVISLRQPLAATYARSTTTVSANVAAASHGETVRDEVLGSGDGSAFQRFTLRKSPLTYVQAPSAESGLASALQVAVNGVRWTERSDLTEAGPQERVFSASQDEANKTTVMFGDGVNGARPPTGRDSVHARYRFGIGAAGDVAAGAITKLVDSLPGLQAVVNPEPTSGGADPESNESVRSNAPASLRTFGRAVSIEDYAALALAYPGVRLARAAWVRKDDTGKALAHPAIYVTVTTANGMPVAQQADYAAKLRRFLDSHRDPNVPMRIVDAGRVYIDIAAIVDVDDAYGRHATLRAAQAALYPGTNPDGTTGFFGRLGFGEAVHLSSVYAAVQMVAGVRAADITTLRLAASDAPGTVRDHILVAPSAIAFIANDPSDLSNQYGKVSVDLGVGGFAD